MFSDTIGDHTRSTLIGIDNAASDWMLLEARLAGTHLGNHDCKTCLIAVMNSWIDDEFMLIVKSWFVLAAAAV
jgi:hypothetical protein